MSMFDKLTAGGIAVVGRTGSGKSTMFHGSQYVLDVLLADTGSQAHRMHHRGGGEVTNVTPLHESMSPIEQVRQRVIQCEKERRLWCLDSWSALEWQACAHFKRVNKRQSMSQPDHKVIVNQLRDLALELSLGHGFTIFNTGMGGVIKTEDGTVIQSPKGALTGYPALSGCTPGTETVLSRWSSVWVCVPGVAPPTDGTPHLIPRGIMLPWDDFRGGDYGSYTPIKDGYAVLSAGTVPMPDGQPDKRTRVDPMSPIGTCHIDVMLERISTKWPEPEKAPKRRKPVANGVPNDAGVEAVQQLAGVE